MSEYTLQKQLYILICLNFRSKNAEILYGTKYIKPILDPTGILIPTVLLPWVLTRLPRLR